MLMNFKVNHCKILALSAAFVAGTSAVSADLLDEGRQAFMDYDFERAAELYDKYEQTLKRRPNAEGEALLEKLRLKLEIAENSLENVQKIEVIDRIDVPANHYINAIKLPADAGHLLPKDKVPVKGAKNVSDFVFSNESGDFAVWTELDSAGMSRIVESHRLTDGQWETPHASGNVLNEGGEVKNPFMLSDGVTLYFAGNGEGSMGGYDLFVASKDATTGEFRQPTTVGFPFNSPFNEYLMAIDEDNGIGWWVTDRNRLENQVSVYVFRTNDVRRNYNAEEEENIMALARLDDISITQKPKVDYQKTIKEIAERAQPQREEETGDFFFPMPGGKVYRHLSDFKSTRAQRNFSQYRKAKEEYDSDLEQLRRFRMEYHKAGKGSEKAKTMTRKIEDWEAMTEQRAEKLKKMKNAVISAENKE